MGECGEVAGLAAGEAGDAGELEGVGERGCAASGLVWLKLRLAN